MYRSRNAPAPGRCGHFKGSLSEVERSASVVSFSKCEVVQSGQLGYRPQVSRGRLEMQTANRFFPAIAAAGVPLGYFFCLMKLVGLLLSRPLEAS